MVYESTNVHIINGNSNNKILETIQKSNSRNLVK